MSRIIFQKSYIVLVPSFDKAAAHKHPFMHLFYSKSGCKITVGKKDILAHLLLLDSNIAHSVKKGNHCDLFLLIDPTSTLAEKLQDKYLQHNFYHAITANSIPISETINCLSDKEIIKRVENMLLSVGITTEEADLKDERVEAVIANIISGKWLDKNVSEIAKSVFLSESRLTHLFKEEVGISLKSYILIRRLEHAYRLVSAGEKITRAAQESGFSSSAHLAYTCKHLTGVSITDVLKSSKKTADF